MEITKIVVPDLTNTDWLSTKLTFVLIRELKISKTYFYILKRFEVVFLVINF